jgi:hypothetical protein
VQLTAPLTYSFGAGSFVAPVESVTYELTKGSLLRNGHALIPNVTDLRFTYDSDQPAAIRLITVSMTVAARVADPAAKKTRTVTMGTRITPPNLVL